MACSDYAGKWYKALDPDTMAIRDAVLCGFQDQFTGPLFAALIVMGMVNVPIYIRTQSPAIPFVITLTVGGVMLTQLASVAQAILLVGLLVLFGIVPVLILRRLNV